MKRTFIMLLVACSAITTANADSTATPQKKAKSVIQSLEGVIAFHAEEGNQTLSVTKNPETGLIESSERIAPFTCGKEELWNIPIGFSHDEPLSYQYMHLLPGNTELFNLKVMTNSGQKSKDIRIRTNSRQEMWFMCCKNPDNPQLRDAYAIVWEETKDKKVAGTVFMITSLRPDMYEKSMSSAGLLSDNKNTFTIDGRVGYDLTDSLYVVYMADTAEELNNVRDSDFVAYMPVVNKRFSFSVQIDKPKVGRIRTVMPDGSLCQLWTNLDFVPGETYRITTHNGYYDEDLDYEHRVGRYSGKSLLNKRQIAGNDDVITVEGPDDVVIDDVVIDDAVVHGMPVIPQPRGNNDWRNSFSPQQKMEAEHKMLALKMSIDNVKNAYTLLGGIKENSPFDYTNDSNIANDIYKKIILCNKEMDKNFHEIVKVLKVMNIPQKEMIEGLGMGYKEMLNIFTDQNKAFNEIYKKSGRLTKATQKAQKYVNKLTEKYMKEASELMLERK